MKTFLICPVRDYNSAKWEPFVDELVRWGWEVYWPSRDTDQNDSNGLRICMDNFKAIRQADVVHVIWDGKSQGVLFDLGMAFALGKKIITVSLPNPTECKSFQNMIMSWASESQRPE